MLNDLSVIKGYWPGDVLNNDDLDIVREEKTAYDLFLEREVKTVTRRLKKWCGSEALVDAGLETPVDQDRADALKDSELELIHVSIMEQLWRDKCAGAERDIQLPSGMRITLQAFSGDDCRNIISAHLNKAESMVLDYLI